jgi:hypothetical protein
MRFMQQRRFGYFGRSYVGGGWSGGQFRYNSAVTNVNTTIVHNVYVDKTVIVNNTTVNRVSYNGGQGGIPVRPSATDLALRKQGRPMTSEQTQHEHVAAQDRNQLASVNHGRPQQLAVSHPFTPQTHPVEPLHPEDRVAAQTQAKPAHPTPVQSNSIHAASGAHPPAPSHTVVAKTTPRKSAKRSAKQPKHPAKKPAKPVAPPAKEQPRP